jgi:hypothetical protein
MAALGASILKPPTEVCVSEDDLARCFSDPWVLEVYVSEVGTQCRFALDQLTDIMDHLEKVRLDGAFSEVSRLFSAVQAFLVSAACVSQLLWGSARVEDARGPLREALSVDSSSVLKSRSLRNHFIHIDSRLDTWAKSGERNILDMTLNRRCALPTEPDARCWFRNFDPKTWTISFGSEEYDVTAIVSELARLEKAANEHMRHEDSELPLLVDSEVNLTSPSSSPSSPPTSSP